VGTVVVEATGYTPSQAGALGIRSVKSFLDMTSIFEFGLFASQAISLSSQARTDSYDSENGLYNQFGNINLNGDVGTNGDISMSGQAFIGGDALIGQGATFNDTSRLSGSITSHPPLTFNATDIPQELLNMSSQGSITNTTTLTPGYYKYDSIELTGPRTLTLVGPINIYLVGNTSLRTTGQAKIVVSIASTGPVKIYAQGDVSMSGQGVINQTNLPENFLIFGTNPTSQQINIVGQGAYYGAIYAPTATLSISGTGGFYGAYCGKLVDCGGQAFIHYDEALTKITAASQTIDIPYWQEM
jgi:hypothetical protein